MAIVEGALAAFGAIGDVLELTGGTGWWTERLARTAEQLTVVDSSPETLVINRERVSRADVDYVVADLFGWRPERRYDVVFFGRGLVRRHPGDAVVLVRVGAACLIGQGD